MGYGRGSYGVESTRALEAGVYERKGRGGLSWRMGAGIREFDVGINEIMNSRQNCTLVEDGTRFDLGTGHVVIAAAAVDVTDSEDKREVVVDEMADLWRIALRGMQRERMIAET